MKKCIVYELYLKPTALLSYQDNVGTCRKRSFHHAGTSAAVWNMEECLSKVEAWRPEMQLESDTIRFVTESRHSYTECYLLVGRYSMESLVSHFLITIKGRTLNQAWNTLSPDCRTQLANTVGRFCKALAISTSGLETADGKGIVEPFLTTRPAKPEPLWKPQLEVLRDRKLSSWEKDC